MRIATLLSLTFFVAACGDTTPSDELAGESSADGDDTKADSNGTYTYYNVTADWDGGVWVDRVNRAETACAGGVGGPSWESYCYAASVDWSGAGMSADQIAAVSTMMDEDYRVLVRGNLRTVSGAPRLLVTEAWVGQTDGYPDGVFVKVKDTGIRCITTPCESNGEYKLNSALSSTIAGVDFSPSGADDSVISKASDAIAHDGMIIAGYRYTIYESGRQARGREAYQVYLRVTAAAPEAP